MIDTVKPDGQPDLHWVLNHACALLREAVPDARVICAYENPLAPVVIMLPGHVFKWHPAHYAHETLLERLERWIDRTPRPLVYRHPAELRDFVISALAGSFSK